MDQKEAFKVISEVVFDAYFLTDKDGLITEYNRMFYALFPRSIARKLKGVKLTEVMTLPVDIVTETLSTQQHMRLDEIIAQVQDMEEYRFSLSSLILTNDSGETVGSLVLMRNVTDEAMIQIKYQEMLEQEEKARELLIDELKQRTESLIETSTKYFALKEKIRMRAKGQLSPFMYMYL